MKLFETKRLIIQTLSQDDTVRFSEYRNKKEVAFYQSWNYYSLKKAEKRIAYCLKHPLTNKIGNYQVGIYLKDSQYLIGDLFVEIDGQTTFSLGYTLDSLYWGKGFGSEAVNGMLDYLHQTYDFKICLCRVYDDNERSIHLLQKNGFQQIGHSSFYGDVLFSKKLDS